MLRLTVYRRVFAALLVSAAISTAQVKLDFVTQIKGRDADTVKAVAVDRDDNIIIAGITRSPDLATSGVVQSVRGSSNLYKLTAEKKLAGLTLPSSDRLLALTPDPRAADTWLISTARGLFKTSDAGQTWMAIGAGLPQQGTPVLSVVFSPAQPGLVYAAVGKHVYRSTDGGSTFVAISPEFVPEDKHYGVMEIAIDPASPSTLFAYAVRKSYRTDDGGSTWKELPIPVRKVEFDHFHRGTIYALYNYAELVVSRDGGATWKPLSPGVGEPHVIVADPKISGRLYLGTNHVLKISDDGGNTWRDAPLNRAGQVNTVTVDGLSGTVYAGVDYDLVAGSDGFRTSQKIGSTGWIGSLAIIAGGGLLVAPAEMTDDGFVAKLNRDGQLIWATYLGGAGSDAITTVAVDPAGNVYVARQTSSLDLAFDTDLAPANSPYVQYATAFVSKLASDGTRLYYTTKISEGSNILDLAVDSAGAAYFAGTTTGGHPTTAGVVQPGFNGRNCSPLFTCSSKGPSVPLPPATNAFATKLAPDGRSLAWSTYLGQQYDNGTAIALDTEGNVFVAGSKIWKLDPAGARLLLTIPHPGIHDLKLDSSGNFFVTGWSGLPTYASLPGDRSFRSDLDSFVVKYTPEGITAFTKYLGGEQEDNAHSIVVDDGGNATVVGTASSQSFPTVGPIQSAFSRRTGFVVQLNQDASQLTYSTYVGDSRPFTAAALTRDSSGNVIFVGNTLTPQPNNYPITYSLESEADAFVRRVRRAQLSGPRLDSVENLASLQGGPVAPGELIQVRGAEFGSDAVITMDGIPLEVFSRSGVQIVAALPDDLPVESAREFVVEAGGVRSNPVLVRSAPFAPAIFTQDRSGHGAGLIFNEDGTLNSADNPAAKGSVITIVGNGIGKLQPVNGSVVAAKPVNVFIGGWFANGVAARVQEVAGLPAPVYVIKVFVPDPKPEHAPDYRMPPIVAVNLEIDGVFSQASVALAVK